MKPDRDIQRTIASGERNKEALELIHNWCRHARVEKFGGTGIIEMETGLPIGHHSMACDYAPAGGVATWDLHDAAIDFHDRNCAHCANREPVRLPNLTRLLQQRDAYQELAQKEERARLDKAVSQRADRQQVRQSLRREHNPLSASIVDLLEELDQDSPGDAEARLLGAAQLAPETFTSAILEHCFCLLESRECWFDESGLRLLNHLQADRKRLTRCALFSLSEHRSIKIAAAIVQANNSLADESLVGDALPALVALANPERSLSWGDEHELMPGPLLAIYEARRAATEVAIGKLLDEHDPYLVSCGARAIHVLSEKNKAVATKYIRTLVAKLARAHLLIDDRDTCYRGDDEVIWRLQEALALALEDSPNETDTLMAQFIESASNEGEVRIYKVYDRVLRAERQRDDQPETTNVAARVALKRMIYAATTSTNEEVLREVQSAFSYVAENLNSLARAELTNLLGAAILIDDRIQRIEVESVPEQDFWKHLEWQNHRQLLQNLQGNVVKWAATAASGDESAIEQYIEILSRIPDGQDWLRSVLIKNAYRLMTMPDGLNAALPTLYTAMLGTSTLVRAAAARAVGKLSRRSQEDLPDLLYEAYTALLSDPYVIVHRAAVRALEHVTLPNELDRRAKGALAALIECYAVSHSDDHFLLQCIELYLHKYTNDQQKRGHVGEFCVALLEKMKSDVIVEKLAWLRHDLGEIEGFGALIVRTLADPEVSMYKQDNILRALNDLPSSMILAHKSQLQAIASASDVDWELPANLVETLTRAGAWVEAARINDAIYEKIPNTTQLRVQKLTANLDRIAARYEEAIALGRIDSLQELAQEWRNTEAQLEEHRNKYAERRGPFPGFSSSH